LDGGNGDVAVDQYHHYKKDIGIMSAMGVDAYRFSISLPRLIPDGEEPINPKGLEYYNNLINELLSHGIQPHITLYHFDLPQALEDSYGGFLNPRIVEDSEGYADVCFREFGDRVKYWSTFNEPNIFTTAGYDYGFFPPQRCSQSFGNCTVGNSTIEPYIVGHHVLLSHIAAVELYRKTYQAKKKGCIGLVILDVAATQRANDFMVVWFFDPFVFGDYPESIRNIVGSRLPSFTKEHAQRLQGSLDFIGVDHYFTMYCFDVPRKSAPMSRDYAQDMSVGIVVERDGISISVKTSLFGMPVVPQSIQAVLEYTGLISMEMSFSMCLQQ
jgi:beta-glucosidase